MTTFQTLTPNLFAATMPFSLGPVRGGARCIIARLPDDTLWVHSPIELDANLRREIEGLGRVAHVVAPNTFHFGHHAEWVAAFPDARFYALPDMKLPKGGRFDETLSETPPTAWRDAFQIAILRAGKFYREAIFLHLESGTLIVTDLLFNLPPTSDKVQKISRRILGMPTGPGISRLERFLISDHAAARQTLQTVLSWQWDRLSMAHGEIIESNGKAAFQTAHARLI